MGEAEQEGRGRKRKAGPGKEPERNTLDHRSGGTDIQRLAQAVRALDTHRASSFLGSWRALPSAWAVEPKWLMFPT